MRFKSSNQRKAVMARIKANRNRIPPPPPEWMIKESLGQPLSKIEYQKKINYEIKHGIYAEEQRKLFNAAREFKKEIELLK